MWLEKVCKTHTRHCACAVFHPFVLCFGAMAGRVVECRIESCPLCETFAAPNLKGVVRHVGLVHSHEPGFRLTGGVEGCTRSYTKFNSYKKHMYVKYAELMRVTQYAEANECSLEVDELDSS